jgi:hypothetical protein
MVLVVRGTVEKFAPQWQSMVWKLYAAHVIASALLVLVTLYLLGGGDLFAYRGLGGMLAQEVTSNFGRYGGELLKLTFRMESEVPVEVHGSGSASSTGAMFGISAWLMMITGGSAFGAGAIISALCFVSKSLIYLSFRDYIPERSHKVAILAIMAVPSVLFWTSGLLKEGIAMAALGWVVYGAKTVIDGDNALKGAVLIVLGCVPIYLVKTYILFPLTLAISIWMAAARVVRRSDSGTIQVQPIYVIIAFIIGTVGLGLLGRVAPQYSFAEIGNELAHVQMSGSYVSGTSNYQLTENAAENRGLGSQLALAPLAFLFSLIRPVIFESSNLQIFVNSLESTFLTYLLLRMIFRYRISSLFGTLMRNPYLLFCVVFVILFGTGVGLGSTNVGSLSRYRAPMMPFYVLGLVAIPGHIAARVRGSANQPAQEQNAEQAGPSRARRPSMRRRGRRMAAQRRRRNVPERVARRSAAQERYGRFFGRSRPLRAIDNSSED